MIQSHFRITEHSQPSVRWYVVDDMDENGLCSFEIDAYVVGWEEDGENGLTQDLCFVVLFDLRSGTPLLYAPRDLPGHAISQRDAITRAVAAYRKAHPARVRALELPTRADLIKEDPFTDTTLPRKKAVPSPPTAELESHYQSSRTRS